MEPIIKQLETKTYIDVGSEGEMRSTTGTSKGRPAKLMRAAAKIGSMMEDRQDRPWDGVSDDAARARVKGGDWRAVDSPKGRRALAEDLGLPNKKKTGKTSNPKRFYNPFEAASPRNPYNRK